MGAGHSHEVFRSGHTVVHRLPPHYKLLAALAFTLAVVCTPRERFWAFACYGLLLAGVALAAAVSPGFVVRRMVVEVPFVLFAAVLPIIGQGARVDVLGMSLSQEGLLTGWNILAKATLGVVTSILLAATTEPRELLLGARRLRVPQLIVQIATFMLRYAAVITGEMRRMRIARESRGFAARDVRHIPAVATSAGALFIRSYERGERVHLAMLSRGYSGTMPVIGDRSGTPGQRLIAGLLPLAALAVTVPALLGVL